MDDIVIVTYNYFLLAPSVSEQLNNLRVQLGNSYNQKSEIFLAARIKPPINTPNVLS